jgi:hypothetical protein
MNLALPNPFAFPAFLGRFRTRPPVRQPLRVAAIPNAITTLDKGAFLALPADAGATVTCLNGALWITHDNQPVDIVISAGESYTRCHESRMLVFALQASSAMVG